jgi:hypothetical protein
VTDLLAGILYRGSAEGVGCGLGALGAGLYLTWDRGFASAYADIAGGTVTEYRLRDPEAVKLLVTGGVEWVAVKAKLGLQPWEYSDDPVYAAAVTLEVRELGYDGVLDRRPEIGLVLFDPDAAVSIS